MARKIYVDSFKGGSGVTTFCAGLGIALARRGERTLLVDGDSVSGSAMLVAGLTDMQVYTLADCERAICRVKQTVLVHPKCRNFAVMPSLGLQNRNYAEKALNEISGLFDFILSDKLAPGACDEAIIVTEPYAPSVKRSDACRSALADDGFRKIGLVINKFDGGQASAGEIDTPYTISELLRLELLAVIPEDATIPLGRWKKRTCEAFFAAADKLTGRKDGVYDAMKGYSGINGAIKRKLREKI